MHLTSHCLLPAFSNLPVTITIEERHLKPSWVAWRRRSLVTDIWGKLKIVMVPKPVHGFDDMALDFKKTQTPAYF